jgi:hypothetical protein
MSSGSDAEPETMSEEEASEWEWSRGMVR